MRKVIYTLIAASTLCACQQNQDHWLHEAPAFIVQQPSDTPGSDGLKALNGKFHYNP